MAINTNYTTICPVDPICRRVRVTRGNAEPGKRKDRSQLDLSQQVKAKVSAGASGHTYRARRAGDLAASPVLSTGLSKNAGD